MGIAVPSLLLLLNEHKVRPFSGSVLQLGRQDIYFDWEILTECARQLNVPLNKPSSIGHRPNQWMPGVKTLDDHTFFHALGFDEVKSTDTSDYEQADIIHDFNQLVPENLHGQFDVIFDGGSLEHIFHVPNALANFHNLLKVGGRTLHHVPTHNFVDHGFYCFSPTLFCDYYEANGYANLSCQLVGMTLPYKSNNVPKVFDYKPGMLEAFSIGGMAKEKFHGCEMFMTTFSATKQADSRGDIIPTQRRYQQWWAKAKANLPY